MKRRKIMHTIFGILLALNVFYILGVAGASDGGATWSFIWPRILFGGFTFIFNFGMFNLTVNHKSEKRG